MGSNVYDYLAWRGDLTLAERPFNGVDNLILSLLSYIDLKDIVPLPGQGEVSIAEAAKAYFARRGAPKETLGEDGDTAVEWDWLFHLASQTERFGPMMMSCYVDKLDTRADKQFAAVSIETEPGRLYLAYRGTSDDLAGWKEDLLLACVPQIPSHQEAKRYLTKVAELYPDHSLTLGGHSKGGNLAVYAAVTAKKAIRPRISAVWTNDGPGFQQEFVDSGVFADMVDRIHVIVPKSSMIGLLLTQRKPEMIVDSSQRGVLQHDGISWQVIRGHFVKLTELSAESLRSEARINEWIGNMDLEQRRHFVDALFQTLSASGEQTVSGILQDVPKFLNASYTAMKDLDKETRERVLDFIHLLIDVAANLENEQRRIEAQLFLRAVQEKLQAIPKVLWGTEEKQEPKGEKQ